MEVCFNMFFFYQSHKCSVIQYSDFSKLLHLMLFSGFGAGGEGKCVPFPLLIKKLSAHLPPSLSLPKALTGTWLLAQGSFPPCAGCGMISRVLVERDKMGTDLVEFTKAASYQNLGFLNHWCPWAGNRKQL